PHVGVRVEHLAGGHPEHRHRVLEHRGEVLQRPRPVLLAVAGAGGGDRGAVAGGGGGQRRVDEGRGAGGLERDPQGGRRGGERPGHAAGGDGPDAAPQLGGGRWHEHGGAGPEEGAVQVGQDDGLDAGGRVPAPEALDDGGERVVGGDRLDGRRILGRRGP